MRQHIFIKKLFAAVLLFLFVLSNTPRQVLHDLFASHTDNCQPLKKNDSKEPQLARAGINCQCLNLVVENPFVETNTAVECCSPVFSIAKASVCYDAFYTAIADLPSLRGPPSLI